jgi:hypothetical protein
MASESVIQRTFASGELAPALAARADLAKYTTGLKRCRNFLVQRHGGVSNRAGLRWVEATKDYDENVRLARYVSEVAGESILIELGVEYFRFFKNRAPIELNPLSVDAWSNSTDYVVGDIVRVASVNYYCILAHTNHTPPNATYWYAMPGDLLEIPHDFDDPLGVYYRQSGRVITFCHIDKPSQELTYGSDTFWSIATVATTSSTTTPTGMGGSAGGAGALTYRYRVTAAGAGNYEESDPSAIVTFASCAAPTAAAPNVITWGAVSGAPEYYVGTATGAASFRDAGFTPKFEITPPISQTLFGSTNNYPSVVAYHQQRRFFAHTRNGPDQVFGSRVGFPSNFGIASPLQDDDSIAFRMAGNQHHPVRQHARRPGELRRRQLGRPVRRGQLHPLRRGPAHPGSRPALRAAERGLRRQGPHGVRRAPVRRLPAQRDRPRADPALDPLVHPQRRRAARADVHPGAGRVGLAPARHGRG